MKLEPFNIVFPNQKKQYESQDIGRLQKYVETSFAPLVDVPLLGHIQLEEISLSSGTENWIEHGLGRAYTNFIVCRAYELSPVAEIVDSRCDKTKYLPLKSPINQIINLVVW